VFFKENSISSSLQRVFNYRVGRFRVTRDNLVLVKVGGKIISLGLLQEELEKIEPKKINLF